MVYFSKLMCFPLKTHSFLMRFRFHTSHLDEVLQKRWGKSQPLSSTFSFVFSHVEQSKMPTVEVE